MRSGKETEHSFDRNCVELVHARKEPLLIPPAPFGLVHGLDTLLATGSFAQGMNPVLPSLYQKVRPL